MNIYLIMFGCIFITAGIMEPIRAKVVTLMMKEMTCKSLLWSMGMFISFCTVVIGLSAFKTVMGEFNLWKAMFYSLVVYFIQKDVTMEVLKPIIKKIKERI